jgi:hypothetical protein
MPIRPDDHLSKGAIIAESAAEVVRVQQAAELPVREPLDLAYLSYLPFDR